LIAAAWNSLPDSLRHCSVTIYFNNRIIKHFSSLVTSIFRVLQVVRRCRHIKIYTLLTYLPNDSTYFSSLCIFSNLSSVTDWQELHLVCMRLRAGRLESCQTSWLPRCHKWLLRDCRCCCWQWWYVYCTSVAIRWKRGDTSVFKL